MRLLNKTSRTITLFSIPLIIISFVIFYFLVQYINIRHLDQNLLEEKEHFSQNLNHQNAFIKSEFTEDHFTIIPVEEPSFAGDTLKTILVYDSLEQQYEPYRELISHLKVRNQYYRLHLRDSMIEDNTLWLGISLLMFLMMVIFLVVYLYMKQTVSKRLWKPFYKALDELDNFDLKNPKQLALRTTDIGEFEELNHHLKLMTDKIIKDYRLQRDMFNMVSHEIQTPLAIIRTSIETMYQLPDVSEEQFKILSQINVNVARLARYNKSILFLSKIEAGGFINETEINISVRLNEVIEEYQWEIENKNITVEKDIESVTLKLDNELASALLRNLIQNTLRHNHNGGSMSIVLEKNLLKISNTGASEPLDIKQITTRFFKKSSTNTSTGLGMNIIKGVCEYYHFPLEYAFDVVKSEHSFIVRFKK